MGQEAEGSALLIFPKLEVRQFAKREGISKVGNLVSVSRTKYKEPVNDLIIIQL